MPSLLACCFLSNARMRTADIQRLVWRVYPYICAELALRWSEAEIGAVDRDRCSRRSSARSCSSRQCRSERVAAPAVHLARGHPAVLARRGHDSNDRTLLPGDRAPAAVRLGDHHARGTRATLPSDGAAHVDAVRPELARILRQEPVPQLHRPAVPPPGDTRSADGTLEFGRAAAGRRRRRSVGAIGADPARHPAGDVGVNS